MQTELCHITILEPHKRFGEAVRSFLASRDMFKSVSVLSTIMELDALSGNLPFPDVLIVDTMVLQGKDLDRFQYFTHLNPGVTTIAISMQDNIPALADIIGMGFKGYIRREDVYIQLIPVIQSTLSGKYHFKGHFDCKKYN